MTNRSVYSPANFALAIGGGLSAALLFAVLGKGSFEGFLLSHLAPLPIMIVCLALGVSQGATAAIVGTLGLSIWPHPLFGMAFGLLVALPAWLSCYACAGAPFRGRDWLERGTARWAVTAQTLAVAAAVALFIGMAALSSTGTVTEPLAYLQEQMNLAIEAMKTEGVFGEKANPEDIKRVMRQALPAMVAGHMLLVQAINLWLAARIVQFSGMLQITWPDIAAELALPRWLAVLLVIGFGLSFVDGPVGAVGLSLAAPIALAFGFQGLAVTHYWLRGSAASVLLLGLIYFCIGVFGAPMMLFSILGLADVVLRFRERSTRSPRPDGAV
ncbi:DUF2232 domain-containing protein [Methylocystis bryophila]|uniref:DUF2232 domain-containing protein n=1 Tax=Methylocystis bryophila TaxID=655015 RepID=A0A1W6MWG4_9HYPH|nr:DUF2232 domain-containing protein [Methylocystis bryophila]ARN81930.1 hypothetical protein B1812_13490 [Methylocystis bryophila]